MYVDINGAWGVPAVTLWSCDYADTETSQCKTQKENNAAFLQKTANQAVVGEGAGKRCCKPAYNKQVVWWQQVPSPGTMQARDSILSVIPEARWGRRHTTTEVRCCSCNHTISTETWRYVLADERQRRPNLRAAATGVMVRNETHHMVQKNRWW